MAALILLLIIAMYVLNGLAFMRLSKLAGRVDLGWMAWVPIANIIQQLLLIKKSGWNIFWLLVPIANIVFYIIWQVRLLQAFGKHGAIVILAIIPYVNMIYEVLWIVWGFSTQTRYTLPISGYATYDFKA
ncbi:DUF5684 domain-containing protein [Alicyclobacillus ferrooxydans]|uniref:Signal peptidase I n=1 Tax=Alicyclobacillus ferrooxydans TaxID=471514 RepID=A0A0P9D338_9BACL|nr:DUF5684 domain-containing protein [Alicyclobacillus ferrooxydans]KPV43924.1 hypothetical protein AN477_09350 [Alicyclobacillus ferrooxydans]